MASPLSFAGISSGLQTDKLLAALMDQASQPLYRLQARQDLNNRRISAYQGLGKALNDFATAFKNLGDTALQGRVVTNSDTNNTNVSATASGAATGSYQVQVAKVATKASQTFTPANTLAAATDLGGTPPYNLTLTLARPSGNTTTTIQITSANNTLNGVRDAINNAQTGVVATLVQTGATTGTPGYNLVLTAKDTGAGSVALTGGPAALGTSASSAGQDADFKVNGIQIARSSNLVTDVAQGVSFTLKAGSSDGTYLTAATSTLTVAQDKAGATSGFQDAVSKFNAALKVVTDASGPNGALANDSFGRTLLSTVRAALGGAAPGTASTDSFLSLADLGLKTNQDGTLSLDATKFQAALDKDPGSVAKVIGSSASSSTGIAAKLQSVVDTVAGIGSGQIYGLTQRIGGDNARLGLLITQQQTQLDRKRTQLQDQFSQLESTIGQLQAAGQGLGAIR